MRTVFASDVHVSARHADRAQAFIDFLYGPCHTCQRVILLGDIFDAWLGDDDDREPHPAVCDALARLSDRGINVDFMPGNHDFLIGEAFLTRTGCRLLGDEATVDVGSCSVLVLHGDTLCTRDEDYQQWRRTFTNARNQAQFLALPFAQRAQQAAQLVHHSMLATRDKPQQIMDVSEEAVLQAFDRHRVSTMVHGHTHRPGIHRVHLRAMPAHRYVLGDWHGEERILLWDERGPRLGCVRSLFTSDSRSI